MSRPLLFSFLFNLFLVAGIVFIVHRLGGWRYTWYRLQRDSTALYDHRRQLFERLPVRSGALVMLGDSQTEQGEWRELLGDTLPVLNRGIAGDQVAGIKARLEEVLRHKPLKIFLLVGINDLIFGRPIPEIEAAYREITARIQQQSPTTELVLQSILPVNSEVRNMPVTNQQVQALNARLVQIAQDQALPYIDIFSQLTDTHGNLSAAFTEDGLHLNGQGYLVWKQQLIAHLK